MLLQQAFAYFTTLVLPNMAPVVAGALDIDPHLIGYYTGILYLFSSIGQVSCGGFILRFGAVRMSQISLAAMGAALMTGYFGEGRGVCCRCCRHGVGVVVFDPVKLAFAGAL